MVADNASAGCFVAGPAGVPPAGLDLALEACLLEVDGQVVDSAADLTSPTSHPGETSCGVIMGLLGVEAQLSHDHQPGELPEGLVGLE